MMMWCDLRRLIPFLRNQLPICWPDANWWNRVTHRWSFCMGKWKRTCYEMLAKSYYTWAGDRSPEVLWENFANNTGRRTQDIRTKEGSRRQKRKWRNCWWCLSPACRPTYNILTITRLNKLILVERSCVRRRQVGFPWIAFEISSWIVVFRCGEWR